MSQALLVAVTARSVAVLSPRTVTASGASPAPTRTVSAEAQKHIEAARSRGRARLGALFTPVCNGACRWRRRRTAGWWRRSRGRAGGGGSAGRRPAGAARA